MHLTPLTLIIVGVIVIVSGSISLLNCIISRAKAEAYLIPLSIILIGIVIFFMGD